MEYSTDIHNVELGDCPSCANTLVYRQRRDTKVFYVCCTEYPHCRYTRSLDAVDYPCGWCDDGFLRLRTGRNGEFYGCQNYPHCRHTEPIWVIERDYTPQLG